MKGGPPSRYDSVSRRSLLAAGAAGLAVSASGCISRVGSVVDGDGGNLALSITTVPDDDDRQAINLARTLEANLEAVGIDVSIDLRTTSEFLRSVLLKHDFDIYVGRFPSPDDPDVLYELLHSHFAHEIGWQNPFGFTNLTFDRTLEKQRELEGDERVGAVHSVLESLVEEKPFVPVCTPDEYRVAHTERFAGWDETQLSNRLGYLGLEAQDGSEQLTGIVTDSRPTLNANPFAAHYRDRGTITGLLYDSLATGSSGEHEPWLAESWEWDGADLTITIRPDCQFHDGEPLTAADVAFTFEFLTDTTLGYAESPVPPSRYRRQAAAIEDVEIQDGLTCTVTVGTSRDVGEQLLEVPILPEHVWREAVETSSEPGMVVGNSPWTVLFSNSVPRIGSGPYAYVDRTARDRLELERFDGHFTRRDDVDLPAPTPREFSLLVDPGSASAVQQVGSGRADVTVSPLETHVVDAAGANDDVERFHSPSGSFYHVGFNTRSAPLSDPYFRQVVARLLDREWIVEEVFDGHADPILTPVGEEWTPDELEWNGEDPVSPFLGENGEVDPQEAMTAFRRIGFRYDEDGRIVVNN